MKPCHHPLIVRGDLVRCFDKVVVNLNISLDGRCKSLRSGDSCREKIEKQEGAITCFESIFSICGDKNL